MRHRISLTFTARRWTVALVASLRNVDYLTAKAFDGVGARRRVRNFTGR